MNILNYKTFIDNKSFIRWQENYMKQYKTEPLITQIFPYTATFGMKTENNNVNANAEAGCFITYVEEKSMTDIYRS